MPLALHVVVIIAVLDTSKYQERFDVRTTGGPGLRCLIPVCLFAVFKLAPTWMIGAASMTSMAPSTSSLPRGTTAFLNADFLNADQKPICHWPRTLSTCSINSACLHFLVEWGEGPASDSDGGTWMHNTASSSPSSSQTPVGWTRSLVRSALHSASLLQGPVSVAPWLPESMAISSS